MVSITSLEFKFLVFRYVRESGFTHSAFALGLNSNHSDVDMDNNFSFLQPLDLITEDVSELQKII
uniref:LisH domain-containing protein n=1 Tax=Vitis vinifera TaxID=29760 RepID=F6GZW0_VITVI